ncbi:Cytochrome P450-like protein 41 [Elsinoe fawcettii]|nr:Cytochrome P450-like protein 41 [Elsinoe fawcettii]
MISTMLASPLALVLSAVAALFLSTLWTWTKYPKTPGPFLAQFTKYWYTKKVIDGRWEQEDIELHRKYGKLVRVAPKMYSFDDPESVKTVYAAGTKHIKSDWYRAFTDDPNDRASLFSLTDPSLHARARKEFATLYSMSTLVSYEPYVNNCISVFTQRLRQIGNEKKTIDLCRWLQYYAFDVIGEITFSHRFGFMESGSDVNGIIAGIETSLIQSNIGGLHHWLLPFLFGLIPGGMSRFVKFLEQHIATRFATLDDEEKRTSLSSDPNGPMDFLTKLIPISQKDENSRGLLRSACASNVFAGSDTTGITLSAIAFNIFSIPEVLGRLRAEIDSATKDGRASDPITFKESQELPYFQAVIKESMRLHPATGLPLWRVAPVGGADIAGTHFPAGSIVGANTWVAHRNKDVFGEDADEFRPERWMEQDKERLAQMERYFFPFGLGSRTCIGKNISLLEMGKVVPQLVRRFDFEIVDERLKQEGRLESRNWWFVKQKGFMVNVKERTN